jgi:acyl-CoA thioesterase I
MKLGVFAALLTLGAATQACGKPSAHAAPTTSAGASVSRPRIMIVGDSISAGPGCYKKYLVQELTSHRYTSFELVGEYQDDCGGGVRHSAVSCATAQQFSAPSFTTPSCAPGQTFPGLSTLVAKHRPDVLMLQLGVNDVWSGTPTGEILASYTKLVAQARTHNPRITVAIARIQQIRPDCSADDAVTRRAELLVDAVPAWAKAQNRAESAVLVADLWTGSDFSKAETTDCVHPNDAGARRMAKSWYEALRGILKPEPS